MMGDMTKMKWLAAETINVALRDIAGSNLGNRRYDYMHDDAAQWIDEHSEAPFGFKWCLNVCEVNPAFIKRERAAAEIKYIDFAERKEMSKIEWTGKTWNPVTGCNKVSAGCANCYAEAIANRFWGERSFREVKFHPERLAFPASFKKPQMIFVNSMSDLFHHKISFRRIKKIFAVMEGDGKHHTYQILTKRPERAKEFFAKTGYELPDNVWFGVTAENQIEANNRLRELRDIPAKVRFVSVEPMLEAVKLRLGKNGFIDWVIVGCETGNKRRPFELRWAKSLIKQCKAADVPIFVKQLNINGEIIKNGKRNFPAGYQFREFPKIKQEAEK